MASVTRRPNGHHWIQFRFGDKSRTIRLGKSTKQQALLFASRVELLISSATLGLAPDPPTTQWLATLPRSMQRRVAATGVIRMAPVGTISELVDSFTKSLDVKESTDVNVRRFLDIQRLGK